MPVLGSGHPQADIFMVKFSPRQEEIEEGVAFYGRSGSALLKSLKRLNVDPMTVYGTVLIKCPVADTSQAADECVARIGEEFAIVDPRIVVIMGRDALDTFNDQRLPMARELKYSPGELQQLTPTTSALAVPNIDDCLDEEDRKKDFWQAFKTLGSWYDDLPPY